jgi:GT2 family glycosyltransferase
VHVCAYATGIKQLIGCADMASIDLLRSVIDSYEQYLPRGVGWVHYQQWAKAFEPMASTKAQKSRSVHRGAGGKLRVGILVVDDGDPVDCQRTDASLHGLRDANIRVFGPTASRRARSSFGERLVQALDAKCEVIACVRAGDTLTPLAMHYALAGFDDAQVQVVYTDSEYAGKPWFKPAWNPDYAWGSDYLLDLMLMRADTVRELLMAKVELDNAADLAWQMLAQVWRNGTHAIVHVPRVLYHFHSPLREIEHQSRLCASRKALGRVEPNAVLEQMPLPTVDSLFLPRRLHRSLTKRDRTKSISLIIPTRDRVELLQRCIASLERFTDSKNVEIIVVDNDSIQTKTLTYLRQIARKGIRVLPFPGAFNFSAMNNRAVAAASGEIVGLINNDIEALHDGWLEEMLSHLLSPGVGAVGAKLLWPNDMVQHGGVLLGMGNAAGHFGNLLMDQDWGDHGRNQLVQHVSGVTAACMLVRKKDYLAVGGLDEAAFPVAFNDVDFCLKLRSLGMSIVWTPHARLLHAESASRGHEDTPQKKARAQRELQELRRRWFGVLLRDPAYHPSLSLDSHSQAFGGLASPPRDRSPRTGKLRQHL